MEQKKKEMNVYVYVFLLTTVTALILSLLYVSLNPMFKANKAAAKRKAILKCIPAKLTLETDAQVNEAYEGSIEMLAISPSGKIYKATKEDLAAINSMASNGAKTYSNLEQLDLANEEKKAEKDRVYPVYKYTGDKTYYVVAIRGNGLWDKIWGYIALEQDLNTIAGVFFDHKNETPGLGAEIKDNDDFKAQFVGKEIYEGEQVALAVIKRQPPKGDDHRVKGISGATITCDGVTAMFNNGMKYYEAYFESVK